MSIPIQPRHQASTEIRDPWADECPPKVKTDPLIVDPWDHDYDAAIPNPWADAPDTTDVDPVVVDPWRSPAPR